MPSLRAARHGGRSTAARWLGLDPRIPSKYGGGRRSPSQTELGMVEVSIEAACNSSEQQSGSSASGAPSVFYPKFTTYWLPESQRCPHATTEHIPCLAAKAHSLFEVLPALKVAF